jgi:hypothetical protein
MDNQVMLLLLLLLGVWRQLITVYFITAVLLGSSIS